MIDISKTYVGFVENINDPRRLGRIKVRVQNVFQDIPTEHIPWATPYLTPDGKSFSIPNPGKMVNVFFDGNIYHPCYVYSDKYNLNLQDMLESLSDEDYSDFIALTFDHRTRMYADAHKGITLDFLLNKIMVKSEGINLELKDNNQVLNLGTDGATQEAVLGTSFFKWFDKFMDKLLIPTSLVGNMAAPILKPEIDALITEYKSISSTFKSKHVNIVDNDSVTKLERDSITTEVEHDDTNILSTVDNTGESVNIEDSNVISKETKQNIIDKQQNEKEIIQNAKPK